MDFFSITISSIMLSRPKVSNRQPILSSLFFFLFFNSCSTYQVPTAAYDTQLRNNQDYTFAIYNDQNHLITHPILNLKTKLAFLDQAGLMYQICEKVNAEDEFHINEMCLQFLPKRKPSENITDVYVISHGWNYTINESIENYQKFIDLIKAMPTPSENFRPYLIFITWPSAIRPLTGFIRSVLPFDIDNSLSPITKIIDQSIFFFPSFWKQSINARDNAVGSSGKFGRTPFNRDQFLFEAQSRYFKDEGRNIPVSHILYELMNMRRERLQNQQKTPSFKIHLIGHSFGGKLLNHAAYTALDFWKQDLAEGSKTMREPSISKTLDATNQEKDEIESKWLQELQNAEIQKDLPIESLLLFNPAFDSLSLSGSLLQTPEVQYLIARKGIVYSNYDYPNGLFYDIAQIPFNSLQSDITSAWIRSRIKRVEDMPWFEHHPTEPETQMFLNTDKFFEYPFVKLQQGFYSILSPPMNALMWGLVKVGDLLPHFFYHLRENDTFSYQKREDLEAARMIFNGFHFFLPIDKFITGAPEDQFGLFRLNLPALGKTGGRGLNGSSFATLHLHGGGVLLFEEWDSKSYCDLSERIWEAHVTFTRDFTLDNRITYSINGSKILNSWKTPMGAHGDLRSSETAECRDGVNLEKRQYTMNFIYNFTKALPTSIAASNLSE